MATTIDIDIAAPASTSTKNANRNTLGFSTHRHSYRKEQGTTDTHVEDDPTSNVT